MITKDINNEIKKYRILLIDQYNNLKKAWHIWKDKRTYNTLRKVTEEMEKLEKKTNRKRFFKIILLIHHS